MEEQSMRDEMKDGIRQVLAHYYKIAPCEVDADLVCSISDEVFSVFGISQKEQDEPVRREHMGHYTTIYGQIDSISEASFERIREHLMAVFENVHWRPDRSGTLEIDSYAKHCPEFVGPAFDKIAFALDEGTYGELTISDEEGVSVIFFAGPSREKPHGQWIEEHAQTVRPENPLKGDGKDLYGLSMEEINGEQEYSYELLLRAGNESEAWKKAQERAMRWYDDAGAELRKGQGYHEYYFFGGEIFVRIVQVYKTTKEEWLEREYQRALIDSGAALQ